jgi:hypothetical protein
MQNSGHVMAYSDPQSWEGTVPSSWTLTAGLLGGTGAGGGGARLLF